MTTYPIQLIDPHVLEELDQYDANLVDHVVGLFLETSPDLAAHIETAWAERDVEAVHRGAHTLKSSAAVVGARALSEACRKVERTTREGDRSELGPQVEHLLRLLPRTLSALRAMQMRRAA